MILYVGDTSKVQVETKELGSVESESETNVDNSSVASNIAKIESSVLDEVLSAELQATTTILNGDQDGSIEQPKKVEIYQSGVELLIFLM